MRHLVVVSEGQSLRYKDGKLSNGERSFALSALGSIQCFGHSHTWSQSSLAAIAEQCPVVLSSWNHASEKWRTASVLPRGQYVNPEAIYRLCRLSSKESTHLASELLLTKIQNQMLLLRDTNPALPASPTVQKGSYARVLRLESTYARKFWPKYFAGISDDILRREKYRPTQPINIALSYGYGFLYHAIEWACLAHGLDCSVGLIHKLRRNRPSLACDLIEPLRCTVELTVMRHRDDMVEKSKMAARFAEMLEQKFVYRDNAFRLRSIIRLMVESFIKSICYRSKFHPFLLHARDACL
jgi:CRISPR-associated endonuclease Cas1